MSLYTFCNVRFPPDFVIQPSTCLLNEWPVSRIRIIRRNDHKRVESGQAALLTAHMLPQIIPPVVSDAISASYHYTPLRRQGPI